MSTSVPLSAAEFLARFYATEPAELDYRVPSDLYNDLEMEALEAQFDLSTLKGAARPRYGAIPNLAELGPVQPRTGPHRL